MDKIYILILVFFSFYDWLKILKIFRYELTQFVISTSKPWCFKIVNIANKNPLPRALDPLIESYENSPEPEHLPSFPSPSFPRAALDDVTVSIPLRSAPRASFSTIVIGRRIAAVRGEREREKERHRSRHPLSLSPIHPSILPSFLLLLPPPLRRPR